jgi:hypothetical protein
LNFKLCKILINFWCNCKLTSSAEIHGVANGIVAVDAESHQDVRRRIRDENLLILIFSAEWKQKDEEKTDKTNKNGRISKLTSSFLFFSFWSRRQKLDSDTFLYFNFVRLRYITSRTNGPAKKIKR